LALFTVTLQKTTRQIADGADVVFTAIDVPSQADQALPSMKLTSVTESVYVTTYTLQLIIRVSFSM